MAKDLEIFSPFRMGKLHLRNRIVCPPMVQCRPITSPEGIGWYRRLAAGGAGLVIVEATGVPPFGKDLTAETLRPLVSAIHEEGAAAGIQLFPILFGSEASPNSLRSDELDHIVDQYARAATMCWTAGFDAVEPHGAHGYLINQFFMPDKNQRTDEYGGTLENRARFGLKIVERIQREVGDDLLIFYRHTPVGEAYGLNESVAFAEWLIAAGVDVLDISPALENKPADLAAPFKEATDVPVIAVAGMQDPEAASEAIREGRCDLVAVGRQLLADAEWPNKVRKGRRDDIIECTQCNACFKDLEKWQPVGCSQWDDDPVAAFIR